ncbi:MAG: hypothetical protein ACREV3_04895, partial [Gammaproteobacteria bacterium]
MTVSEECLSTTFGRQREPARYMPFRGATEHDTHPLGLALLYGAHVHGGDRLVGPPVMGSILLAGVTGWLLRDPLIF